MSKNRRLVLIDPDTETREVFAQRLTAQGFEVVEAADAATGAEIALGAPPAAVVCDLWMEGVSGVQLCRLLGAEPATADVPVVLRAENDDARSRFWARHAGARSLVPKGRMGELVRALADATATPPPDDAFFLSVSGDIRDRIAHHLDRALFESVVAAEVRALSSASSFDRMFDSLSQLVIQLLDYRWMALTTTSTPYFALHAHRKQAAAAEAEARTTVLAGDVATPIRILDDDAIDAASSTRIAVYDLRLGDARVGQLAFGIPEGESNVDKIAPLIAREIGAVIRLVLLLEESRRMATTDGLTGLYNRRAFIDGVQRELARASRTGTSTSLLLLDLDHFKSINDTHGHGMGDAVLEAVAKVLRQQARTYDIVARWGGEEFVVALPSTDESNAAIVAERLRTAISVLCVSTGDGTRIPLTVSIGVAQQHFDESLETLVDRADRAMYCAKVGGRDRVARASVEAKATAVLLSQAPASLPC